MGKRGRRKGQALAATLIAAALCAVPAAWAQDASDLEFSLSDDAFDLEVVERERDQMLAPSAATESRFLGLFNMSRVAAIADADVVAAGESVRCEASHYNQIETDLFKMTGVLGATPASNAAEARDGDSDTALSGAFAYEWTHRSRDGACTPNGENAPRFDEDWRIVTAFELNAQDFVDDVNSDSSRATLSFVFSPRLGRSVIGHKFQTRLIAGLYNNVGYSELYDDWSYTNHDARLGVEHLFINDGEHGLRLSLTGGRVYSNPDASSYSYGQLELRGEDSNIGGGWSLITTGRIQFRDYDEATTPREDTIYTFSALLLHEVAENTNIGIGLTVQQRDSTDPNRDYASVSLPITLRRRF